NEAMQMGVPCLVSDAVGCQRDLVTDGGTGWVFRADEPKHLGAKLTEALGALDRDPAGISARVAARIAGYTYVQTTQGLLQALAALMP
ncbi:MAG: glycosyltransferase, partial [Opitutaceae bacterium]